MSFPAYPEYKDSGVSWLGEVPNTWERKPLFALVRELDNKNQGMQENNLLSLSYGNIKRKSIEGADGLLPASFETYQIVERDDIVWRLTDLQNDQRSLRTGIVRERGIITSAYLATRPTTVLPEYLAYLLRAYDLTKVFYSMGGGLRQSMKFADVKWLPVMLPSLNEQQTIAAFLDRETAKIDVLVAAQERLIALLKEKRQAVISHAVTKGLDPDAPMKDSGIEWLGEIPAHWIARPIRKLAKLESGHTPSRSRPEYWTDEECVIPWVTTGDVKNLRDGRLIYLGDTAVKISAIGLANSSARLLPENTVFLSRTASVGFSGIMAKEMAVSQDFAAWICGDSLLPEYLLFCLRSMSAEFSSLMIGSTHKTIYMPDIEQLKIPYPPPREQGAIVERIIESKAVFEDLHDVCLKTVELLTERRAALISAAVTGKVDVRGLADKPALEPA